MKRGRWNQRLAACLLSWLSLGALGVAGEKYPPQGPYPASYSKLNYLAPTLFRVRAWKQPPVLVYPSGYILYPRGIAPPPAASAYFDAQFYNRPLESTTPPKPEDKPNGEALPAPRPTPAPSRNQPPPPPIPYE